jgi:purine-binding chemotaxis protein CheW
LFVFVVANQSYALPFGEVLQVVHLPALTTPPRMPNLLAGFMNVGGNPIPVVRLDRLFGLPEMSPGIYTPLLLLRHPSRRLALMVENVIGIVKVADDAIVPIDQNHTFNGSVVGLVQRDNQVHLLLCAEKILLEQEQHCLAELQDQEQHRLQALEERAP